jgi:hypothetical protein
LVRRIEWVPQAFASNAIDAAHVFRILAYFRVERCGDAAGGRQLARRCRASEWLVSVMGRISA